MNVKQKQEINGRVGCVRFKCKTNPFSEMKCKKSQQNARAAIVSSRMTLLQYLKAAPIPYNNYYNL